MNRNLLIVTGGGFVIALVVAMLVQATLGGKEEKRLEILVAAKPMTIGHTLSAGDTKWHPWPEDSVIPGTIVRKEGQAAPTAATGRLKRELAAGEPLTQAALAGSGDGNILAATLEKGMRASAIKVSAESMVGGFISPGDRVDVVLTHQIDMNGEDERAAAADMVDRHVTETVLENVRVLAVDQRARKEAEEAKVGRTVTLQTDAKGAEKLALASAMGDLSLTLRGLDDVRDAGEDGTAQRARPTTDVQVSAILHDLADRKRASGQGGNSVRVYTGGQVVNVPVRY